MPVLGKDIDSLASFKRPTPEFLRRRKDTGHPVVLTVNGKAALVVQDAASSQRLIDRADRLDSLRISVGEMRAGQGEAAGDAAAETRQILAERDRR